LDRLCSGLRLMFSERMNEYERVEQVIGRKVNMRNGQDSSQSWRVAVAVAVAARRHVARHSPHPAGNGSFSLKRQKWHPATTRHLAARGGTRMHDPYRCMYSTSTLQGQIADSASFRFKVPTRLFRLHPTLGPCRACCSSSPKYPRSDTPPRSFQRRHALYVAERSRSSTVLWNLLGGILHANNWSSSSTLPPAVSGMKE
jgi:hypothetical protein